VELADRWQPGRAREVAGWLSKRALPAATTDIDAGYELGVRLARVNKSLGITQSLADGGFVGELIPDIVADCLASGSRGLANVAGEALTETDLSQLLTRALAAAPHRKP
ncbi:MAG: hypothetical protein H7123_01495, partial [Thermoleophilia bacterium]|nr:hypothetical protein [Thermoleophilia bacterium]